MVDLLDLYDAVQKTQSSLEYLAASVEPTLRECSVPQGIREGLAAVLSQLADDLGKKVLATYKPPNCRPVDSDIH